ncbi:RHS repeat-associated core domain-containing protein [Endozoicomonas arenosclerae]|uniref:RHS repeat-associated core domain-containing protein n=1 Tax=Endozoicomonas arenosclerae TaxID=1633495 RepID=UPI000784328F|nr:RHS repeat-associated core domain-containing protein [Endozoicomonas arenosclerae]
MNYSGLGLAGRIIDPRGIVTDLEYHPRGWLLSSTVQHPKGKTTRNIVTSYDYDEIGQVTRINLPDQSYLDFEYDDARRLVLVINNRGQRIEYHYDAEGNQVSVTVRDSQNSIVRSSSRTFDEMSRLLEQIRGDGTISASYQYDLNSNPTVLTDGKGNQTVQTFDALNRLKQQVSPDNSSVDQAYNAQNQLTAVTDQRSLKTEYKYSSFGNMKIINSPDAGLRQFDYDAAGNMIQKTDAKGVVSQYRYDALNRLIDISYPNQPELNVRYGYDETRKGVGRLTRIEDVTGVQALRYNFKGDMTQQQYTIGGKTYLLKYAYNRIGQVRSITYPSERRALFRYDDLGQVSKVIWASVKKEEHQTRIKLAKRLEYKPFGPLTKMTLHNGLKQTRIYDSDYRLTRLTLGQGDNVLMDLGYDFDLNGNITQINDHQDSNQSQTLAYDKLDRLDTASGAYGDQDYDYDPVGNRTQKVSGIDTQTLNYASDSNRLLSTSSISYQYDTNGNIIQKTEGQKQLNFEYSHNNRLTKVTQQISGEAAITLAEYVYNAQGQRVKKIVSGNTTVYLYSSEGQLLAEIDQSTGKVTREYVYLYGAPLAYIEAQDSGDQIYSIHNDHLNTPQLLTNTNSQTVWSNTDTPFGLPSLNEDVDGDGNTTTFNLRFAGQYFDVETQLHQNYFRDYDPSSGRYMQADSRGVLLDFSDPQRVLTARLGVPIHISDGDRLNHLYGYALQNPLRFNDPTGEFGVGALIPPVAVGVGFYCYFKGLESCTEKYPNHKKLDHPDRALHIQCTASVTEVIARGMGMSSDPIGTATGVVGESAACLNKKQCQ